MAPPKVSIPLRYAPTPALIELYPQLTAATIAKWVESGLIRVDENGQRCEQDVINQFCKRLQEKLDQKAKSGDDLRDELDRARLRKLEAEADIAEIDRDLKRGELLIKSEVVLRVNSSFIKIRTKLMSLPDRFALELSGILSRLLTQAIADLGLPSELVASLNEVIEPTEIRDLLYSGVYEALEELDSEIVAENDPESENKED